MFIDQVSHTIEEYNMIDASDRVLVALSGGADSMALLSSLLELESRLDITVSALHVEHGIRGAESVRDMDYVTEFCRDRGIELSVVRVDAPAFAKEKSLSLEEAARILRYDALSREASRLAESGSMVKIAVAHHAADVAETVLFNLARGTGLDGLAGIKPVVDNVIRPLIREDKSDIEDYLKSNDIRWVEDSTNQDIDISRNNIRHRIMPVLQEINDRALQHVAQSAAIVHSASAYLDKQVDCYYNMYIRPCEEDMACDMCLSKELLDEDDFIIKEVVHRWIAYCAGAKKDITSQHINSTVSLLMAPCGKELSLPYGLTLVSDRMGLLAYREGFKDSASDDSSIDSERFSFSVEDYDPKQDIPCGDNEKWFDYDLIGEGYELRSRRIGDYLQIDDRGSRKTLKSFFVDNKIPKHKRDSVPLLCKDDHVIWIVGYRISNAYKITKDTKRVLKVVYK